MNLREKAALKIALMIAVAMLPYNGVMELLSAGASLGGSLMAFGRIECWYPFLFSFLATCFLFGIFLLAARRLSFDVVPLFQGYWPAGFCIAAAFAYTGLYVVPLSFALGFAVAAGVLSALAYILQVGAYRSILPAVSFKEVVVYMGCCSAIATLAALLVISTSNTVVIISAYGISLVICAIPSLLAAKKGLLGASAASAPSAAAPSAAEASDGAPAEVPAAALPDPEATRLPEALLDVNPTTVWPVLAGAAICMFVMFLALRTPERSTELTFANVVTSWTFVGFMAGSVLVAIAAYVYPDSTKLRQTLITLCPLITACPLIPCVFNVPPEGIIGVVFGLLTGAGYAYFAVVSLSFFFEPGKKFISRYIGGIALLALSSFGFVGAGAGALLSSNLATMTVLALFVAYLIMFAFLPHQSATLAPQAAMDVAEGRAEGRNPIDLRCEVLASEWGLTQRESEILSLLAYGRSQPAIAKELYVSTETVKVHVRHIYEKSGVHSREALLDLLQK